jgi:signal transduction histidine kinase
MSAIGRYWNTTRYVLTEFAWGLATLGAPGLSAIRWRDRGRVGLGWRLLHSLAGVVFGAVTIVPTAAGLATVWFNLFSLEIMGEYANVGMFSFAGWLFHGVPTPSMPTAIWLLFFPTLAFVSVGSTLLISRPLAFLHGRMSAALFGPSAAELAERVSILTSTRADALDAHSAELRRIERDLHDGAQAQLVALSMRLGLAEESVRDRPETATLLREARSGAEEAMTDLRSVIRTMYPPILADRGLAGAISGLAARSIIPVHVSLDDLGQVPAPVEAAAYFVVAESVTNAIKHSGATKILVRVDRDLDGLHLQVTDDGVGGVDATEGTGILGIERRVAALDGATTIHSPIGGGTTVTVELPCR